MPITPPRTLTTLMTSDSAASRALQNVKSCVDPLLNAFNSTFNIGNDNSLAFLRRIKTLTVQAFTAATGTFTTSVTTAAVTTGTMTASGRVIAQGSGFKAYIPMGLFYKGAYATADGYQQTYNSTVSTTGTAFNAGHFVGMPFNGSIVGISALFYGQSANIPCNAQIRGGATTPTFSFTSVGQPYTSQAAYARGTYAFTAGQSLSAYVSFGTAGNNFLFVGAIVEWDT